MDSDTSASRGSADPASIPESPKSAESPKPARQPLLLWGFKALMFFVIILIGWHTLQADTVQALFSPDTDGISASFVTGACGLVGIWHSRFKFTGWGTYMSLGLVVTGLVLGCYTQGAHGLDIQEPGRPTSLLYTPRISPFASSNHDSNVQDLFEQRTFVINMVTQGDSSVFETKWCIDGGANRHVHSVPSDFKNFTSAPVTVHVAKKGTVMEAIGTGDIDLHCVDNMGNPCVLTLKQVLCIPEANKSLISVSMLGKGGYQVIYPCPDPLFLPGMYQQRCSSQTHSSSVPQ